jgi:hypothetical protein
LGVKAYSPAPTSYIQIDFDVRTLSFSNDSARHLVFSQGGDIYVLPAAFFHVDKAPPSISSVVPGGDASQRLAVLNGGNYSDASRVYFDGVAAPVREVDAAGARVTVVPPVAAANHRASVVVLNPDGQSSLFLEGDNPSTYTYSGVAGSLGSPVPAVSVFPSALVAGTEAMVQVDVTGGTLADGQTAIGFGSSDIVVRNTTVISPTRLLANVSVSAAAQVGYSQLSLVSGLQLIAQPFALQVLPPARTLSLSATIPNVAAGNGGISAGASAVVRVSGAPVNPTGANSVLYFNDRPVPILNVADERITFQVPTGTSVGPAQLRVEIAGEKSLPILMLVEPPPPKILSVVSNSAVAATLNSSPTVRLGQLLTLTVENLAAPGAVPDSTGIAVKLGGVGMQVAQVLKQGNVHVVLVGVSDAAPLGIDVPLTLSIGARTSDAISVIVDRATGL